MSQARINAATWSGIEADTATDQSSGSRGAAIPARFRTLSSLFTCAFPLPICNLRLFSRSILRPHASKRQDWGQDRMEGGGKSQSTSIADELFPTGKDGSSSSSPGYFSSVFPPAAAVMGKDSSQNDRYWTLSKQKTDGQFGNSQGVPQGGKPQGNPTKKQMTQSKDGKPVTPDQYEESAYFSSSVHYGGRDFYDSSSSTQVSGSPKTSQFKDDKGGNLNDPDAANRGEWWQGSLYY